MGVNGFNVAKSFVLGHVTDQRTLKCVCFVGHCKSAAGGFLKNSTSLAFHMDSSLVFGRIELATSSSSWSTFFHDKSSSVKDCRSATTVSQSVLSTRIDESFIDFQRQVLTLESIAYDNGKLCFCDLFDEQKERLDFVLKAIALF
jgi:hypothetical protein